MQLIESILAQNANETLQEYIQRFIGWVIRGTGEYPTSVTCQVTIITIIKHLLKKEIEKHVACGKNIHTLKLP